MRAHLTEIQKIIDDNHLTAKQIVNSDETGINWVILLKHQYVPKTVLWGWMEMTKSDSQLFLPVMQEVPCFLSSLS